MGIGEADRHVGLLAAFTTKREDIVGTKMRWALVALAASVLALGGGMAYASIPSSDGVIHACYTNKDGSLRVIDSPSQTCQSKETALNWNTQGPQGPQGPQG